MLLWIAVILLVDAGCALLFENRVRIILPRWNVRVIASIEALIAFALIAWHFY